MLISFLAFILTLGIAQLFIGMFSELMDSPVQLPYWSNSTVLMLLFLAVLLIGFVSGSYPALYLSRYMPVDA